MTGGVHQYWCPLPGLGARQEWQYLYTSTSTSTSNRDYPGIKDVIVARGAPAVGTVEAGAAGSLGPL